MDCSYDPRQLKHELNVGTNWEWNIFIERRFFNFLFFSLSLLEVGKYLFQISSRAFRVSDSVDWKKFTLRRKQGTFHWFIFWMFGSFISLLLRKKIVCLETVNIKGKWKTNQKNNNNNIFFFFFLRASTESINLESMKIEELAKYICRKKISKILANTIEMKTYHGSERRKKTILNISNSIDHVRGSTRSSMIGFSLPVLRIILTINFRAKYISLYIYIVKHRARAPVFFPKFRDV